MSNKSENINDINKNIALQCWERIKTGNVHVNDHAIVEDVLKQAANDEPAEFGKRRCSITWDELAAIISNAVTKTTEIDITMIRRAAELETTQEGKTALTVVAKVLEDNNK